MQDSLKTIASIPEAEIYHQYSQHGATRILQNSWQDPRHSKGFPEDHSKGADCNFSWICMSYSGKSGWFLNYLNLWAYLEYLFIYQGDPISNFHHVNQMPPISPKKKNSDMNYANWKSTHIDADVNNRSYLPLDFAFLIKVQKYLVRA